MAKIIHAYYSTWRRNLDHNFIFCQTSSVSVELVFPRLAHCELSRLCCHGYSVLLSSYLWRIKRKENCSCNACGHQLQDLTSLIVLHPSLTGAKSWALLHPSLTCCPELWAWSDCWVSAKFFRTPILRKGSSSITRLKRPIIVYWKCVPS